VKNIASDQRITGQPLTIALEGRKADVADFSLGAVFDRRKDTPYDQYTARVAGIRLAEVRLGSSDFLPSTITHALLTTGVRVSIPGSRFDGNVTMAFRNLVLTYQGEPRNIGERIARKILSQIKEFDAALRLWNVDRAFDVAFTTNLDDQFAGGLKSALGAELAKVRADIQARVDQTIAQKRQQFEAFYAEKRKEAEKILGDYQGLVDRNLGLVESMKKELNAQLEKVQKGALDGLMNKILKK
jgi:uncharacterized protein (TIGR03545 family)